MATNDDVSTMFLPSGDAHQIDPNRDATLSIQAATGSPHLHDWAAAWNREAGAQQLGDAFLDLSTEPTGLGTAEPDLNTEPGALIDLSIPPTGLGTSPSAIEPAPAPTLSI